MRFIAVVDGVQVQGTWEHVDGLVEARIEDRIYRLEIVAVEPPLYWLQWGDRSIEAVVSEGAVSLGAQRFSVELQDERAVRTARAAASVSRNPDALLEIRAPMPGKIVRTLVAEGDAVTANSGIVVMEAMKMQNEIRAPRAGIVKSIVVTAGTRVGAGDLLATLGT